MEQVPRADRTARVALAQRIEDPRLNGFANRLIYFEQPDLLR